LGPRGRDLLHAINATLAGRDLAANKADLVKASIEFGIDVGPPWLSCFEPYFYPNKVGAGAAPAAPTDLTAQPTPEKSAVRLSWKYSSDNVLYFVVSDRSEERNIAAKSSAGTVSYTWAGLNQGSQACFRVRASNGDTSSGWNPSAGYRCVTLATATAPCTSAALTAALDAQVNQQGGWKVLSFACESGYSFASINPVSPGMQAVAILQQQGSAWKVLYSGEGLCLPPGQNQSICKGFKQPMPIALLESLMRKAR